MADYYVDSTASDDTGDGSIGDPWQYINTHVNSLSAGDIMHVRGDAGLPRTITESESNITVSGTSGNVITIQTYLTEEVKIQVASGDEIFDIDGSYITIDGFEMDKQDNTNQIVDIAGDYVTLQNCKLYNCGFTEAIRILGDYATIDNCEIHDCFDTNSTDAHGILISSSTGTTVSDCTIYDCAGDCIQLLDSYGPVHTVTIEDCTLYTTLANCSENAIDCKDGQTDTIIRRNTIYGFRVCTGTCGGSGGNGEGIIIHQNEPVDILVEDNIIYDCTNGIEVSAGTVTLQNNRIYELVTNDPNESYSTGLYIKDSNVTANIYNNTFDDIGDDVIRYGGGNPTVTYRNNIFNDTGTITTVSGTPVITADHNCWFNATDTHSGTGDVTTDPTFVDEVGNDYHLQAGSDCIDAGVNVGLPYTGSLPDMGAFEYEAGQSTVLVYITIVTVVVTV